MTDLNHRRPLLEREMELDALGELLRRAGDGDGGLLVIEGPAGIGKPSLLAAFAAQAATVSGQTCIGSCAAVEFYGWLELIDQLEGALGQPPPGVIDSSDVAPGSCTPSAASGPPDT